MAIVDLTELRRYTKLPTDATVAQAYLDAAMDYIERYLGRKLESAQHTAKGGLTFGQVVLEYFPVTAITLTEHGLSLTEGTDYTIDREHGLLMFLRWVEEYSCTYTAGYTAATLPQSMKPAIALLIDALVAAAENRGQQLTYESLDGYAATYSAKSAAPDDLTMLSPAAVILLRPFKNRAYIV